MRASLPPTRVAILASSLALLLAPCHLLGATPVAAGAADAPGPEACGALEALDFAEALGAPVRLVAAPVPATAELPERCRVTGTIAPAVGFEAWLPFERWNDRLLVTGCYNLCGGIRADQMEDAAARGYATATTDGGHISPSPQDSGWAFNNVAAEEDFGHRAVHVTTVLAKALAEAFYGASQEHAYFRGCSTGGRQALVAASRYPEDFDGIIAGAPFHPTLSVPYMIWADRANTGADGEPLLRRPEFELLKAGVLAACDAADGLEDGIVGDPGGCAVDPATLACPEGADGACLTPAQVAAARAIYRGPEDSAGRRLAPFGAAPGSEAGWAYGLIGRDGAPPYFRLIAQSWLRYHAFEPDPPEGGPDLAFDFDRDPARLAPAAARIGFAADLRRFAGRDGRLIVHHGWADESLQPAHTLAWWREALEANGAEPLARIARLYLLPGVEHCGGGSGAGEVDYLTALERWVEAEEAPAMLVAVRTRGSVPTTVRQPRFPPAGAIELRRPIFPYPDVARYTGHGDPLDPASYQRVRRGAGF